MRTPSILTRLSRCKAVAGARRSLLLATAAFSVLLPGTAARAYDLPLRADTLAVGERFSTFVHAAGIQAEGKDIGARRYVSDSKWSALKSDGADKTVLGNWVVYGKTVRAMAPGTIVGCWRNAPQNVPGSLHADFVAKHIAGGGNHLWILQDDGVYALYAHMQPGSIPSALCPYEAKLLSTTWKQGSNPDIFPETRVTNGAHVVAGQVLGLVGNSGASSGGPHLHVHMEKGGQPVVMNFAHGMTTPLDDGKASPAGPWALLAGKAMPKATILFWPPHPAGNYTWNGTPGAEYQALFDHMADSGEMLNTVTCSASGATYNSTWVPKKGLWTSHHSLSYADFLARNLLLMAQGYKLASSYNCGRIVAIWRK